MQASKTCPRCGFVTTVNARKCPQCGLEPNHKVPRWVWVGIVVLFLLLNCGVFGMFGPRNSGVNLDDAFIEAELSANLDYGLSRSVGFDNGRRKWKSLGGDRFLLFEGLIIGDQPKEGEMWATVRRSGGRWRVESMSFY